MLSPLKTILDAYRPLVRKMEVDEEIVSAVGENLEKLLDLETFLGLSRILPLFESNHNLIKCAQTRDCYVVEFIHALSICPTDLYQIYVDIS